MCIYFARPVLDVLCVSCTFLNSIISTHSSFSCPGDRIAPVIQEMYQRLLDNIVVSDLPCSLHATRSFSQYKNVFIPPIDSQRLASLDNKLIVIGPYSLRHRNPLDSSDVDVELECSDYTGRSSIININDIQSLHNDLSLLDELDSETLLPSFREKREPGAGNLTDIFEEEVEMSTHPSQQPSLQDAIALTENVETSRSRKYVHSLIYEDSASGTLTALGEQGTPEKSTLVTDTNNNADRQSFRTKRSKHSDKPSLVGIGPAASASFSVQQAVPSSNDIVGQILETAGSGPNFTSPIRPGSTSSLNPSRSNVGLRRSLSTASRATIGPRANRDDTARRFASRVSGTQDRKSVV